MDRVAGTVPATHLTGSAAKGNLEIKGPLTLSAAKPSMNICVLGDLISLATHKYYCRSPAAHSPAAIEEIDRPSP
jgi:hypothetical protein